MKKLFFMLVTLLVYHSGQAQTSTDEKAVRAVIQKMDDAWNAHHYTYSGEYDIYAPDAVMINPVGMYWKSRAEIIQAHQVFGQTMFKNETTQSQQVDVRFLAPTVAMAIIKAEGHVVQDYNFPDGRKAGSKGDTKYGMIQAVLTKKKETWKIASLQVTELNLQAQALDPVKR